MSAQLGGRLRDLRQRRGLSQAGMGELLGMAGKAYQRIESGRQHHYSATLEQLDAAIIAAGFDWYDGRAAELDHESPPDLSVIERLDSIAAVLDAMPSAVSYERGIDRLVRIESKLLDVLEHVGTVERFLLVLIERLERLDHDHELAARLGDALGDLAERRREATPEP